MSEPIGGKQPAPTDPTLRDRIIARPKAELHLHLEGSLFRPTLDLIAQKKDLPRLEKNFYHFGNFEEFDDCFRRLGPLLDRPEDFGLAARALGNALAEQGAVYAEVLVMPLVHMVREVDYRGLIEEITTNFDRAADRGGPLVNLIASIPRNGGPEAGEATLRAVEQFPHPRVIGIDLASVEIDGSIDPFEPTFRRAREMGLETIAHAGEFQPASAVARTLDVLKPSRIGHGISSIQDQDLTERLRTEDVALEISVSSNVMLGAVDSLPAHPIRRLYDAGVPVVINTDDPAFFKTSLVEEYLLLAENFDFTEPELLGLADDSIRRSFAPDELKRSWLQGRSPD